MLLQASSRACRSRAPVLEPVEMLPAAAPAGPRVCNCARPLLTEDTCLRCGLAFALVLAPAEPAPERQIDWSRVQVLRAFEAFMFFRGRAPVPADWSKRMDNWPPLETVEAMFGSVGTPRPAPPRDRRGVRPMPRTSSAPSRHVLPHSSSCGTRGRSRRSRCSSRATPGKRAARDVKAAAHASYRAALDREERAAALLAHACA